jgi:hypothetical protein
MVRVWKWDLEPNGTVKDVAIAAAVVGSAEVLRQLWQRRGSIQNGVRNGLRNVKPAAADVSEAEAVAKSYLTQMGVANPTMVGSHFDGETWTIQARTNGAKGPVHVVRVNAKTRTITGWNQTTQTA